MSQILQSRTKKDNSSIGVANKLHDGKKNNLSIVDIFRNIFFGKPIENKVTNGKSTNKIRDYFNGKVQV